MSPALCTGEIGMKLYSKTTVNKETDTLLIYQKYVYFSVQHALQKNPLP